MPSSVQLADLKRVAPLAQSAVALAVGIHAIGLALCVRDAHRLGVIADRWAQHGLQAPIGDGGELQPLGALEEFLPALAILGFVVFMGRALVLAAAYSEEEIIPGWAQNTWFATGLTLLRPQRVVNAIWHYLEPGTRPPRSVSFWWLGWIASLAVVHRADDLSGQATNASEASSATWLEAAAEVGFVVTGVMVLVVLATTVRLLDRVEASGRLNQLSASATNATTW